jgi:hypothetical protein
MTRAMLNPAPPKIAAVERGERKRTVDEVSKAV